MHFASETLQRYTKNNTKQKQSEFQINLTTIKGIKSRGTIKFHNASKWTQLGCIGL